MNRRAIVAGAAFTALALAGCLHAGKYEPEPTGADWATCEVEGRKVGAAADAPLGFDVASFDACMRGRGYGRK